MKEPLIVGVKHDPTGRLLDHGCRKRFKKEILPLIDQDTLLLLEGDYRKAYFRKRHPKYLIEWRLARDSVGVPISRPIIGWRDGRWRKPHRMKQMVNVTIYGRYCVKPFIALPDDNSETFDELRTAYIHSRVRYTMTSEPSDAVIRNYCAQILEWNEQFDETMIESAREWMESGHHVIILCGGVHALTIHRKVGWPITFLADTHENIYKLTRDVVASVVYPEKVLGIVPKVSKKNFTRSG